MLDGIKTLLQSVSDETNRLFWSWLRWEERREWLDRMKSEKIEFVSEGSRTWEFYALIFTVLLLAFSPFFLPGLYSPDDPIPDQPRYETIIISDIGNGGETYINLKCESRDVIAPEEVAFRCDFRFENRNGSLQKFNEGYINRAAGKQMFFKNWSRVTDTGAKITDVSVRFFTGEFTHRTGSGEYTIHGEVVAVAPRTSDVYSFVVRMGKFFGGERGKYQSVTVFSSAEATTLRTQEILLPFQKLIVVGILLSVVKFWIDLLDRIGSKIQN